MGQYFKSVVLKKNYKTNSNNQTIVSLCAWDFFVGAKLVEHSYVGNNFMKAAMQLLAIYKAHPFVWCGDYADERFTDKDGNKRNAYEISHTITPEELQSMVEKNGIEDDYKYIVNYSKRQYIKVPDYKENQWIMHPLSLLCADGNHRGGGDYYGLNEDKVGIWAYDRLGVTNKRPHYKKIKVEFKEKY